jgi:hypothetical protein
MKAKLSHRVKGRRRVAATLTMDFGDLHTDCTSEDVNISRIIACVAPAHFGGSSDALHSNIQS